MKNKYKILFIATLFIMVIQLNAQDRNVVWVHGFTGDETELQHYDNLFENERQINGLRHAYGTADGIISAANEVLEDIDDSLGTTNLNASNMAIGHSMGGLMIRDMDRRTTDKRFGGYITLTTPIYGAPIANSIVNGSVESAKDDAVIKVAAGPLSEIFFMPWDITPDITTELLGNIFIDPAYNDYVNGNETTIADLRVGSSTINDINNYNTAIPRISIWAQENSPVHWRMFSVKKYGNDTELVGKVNNARTIYNNHYNSHRTLGIIHSFWNPPAAIHHFYKSSQWKKGRDWFDDSENIWSSLIKTTSAEPETYMAEVWIPCDFDPIHLPDDGDPDTDELIPDPGCGHWEWQQRTRIVSRNYPSDGLLPTYTQKIRNNSHDPNNIYHIEGGNHLEVKNMTTDGNGVDETAVEFRKIFDRAEPDFFHTPINN